MNRTATNCLSKNQKNNSTAIDKKIDAYFTLSAENYPSEIYDVYLDKMLHQIHKLQSPYEEGHPTYSQCPICPYFNDIAVRRYSKIENEFTHFTITVEFPEKATLLINVEEKRYDNKSVHVRFQVDISISQPSFIQLKRSIKMQDYLLSWMNSLLMELHKLSDIYQEQMAIEKIENNIGFDVFNAFYILKNAVC